MSRWLKLIAWCAIVLGIGLRVEQLSSRDLFSDEAVTQIRVAGHSMADLYPRLYNGRPWSVRTFHSVVDHVDAQSTAGAVVQSLRVEDAQHPPLFYLAELPIVRILGNSLFAWRILAAICGTLAIAAAYALGRALFASADAGLLAAALLAVSPAQRVYSEQCREYSLFVLAELVATLALVGAMRAPSATRWAVYALITTIGFYTSPFMLSIVVAHGVYFALAIRRNRSLRVGGFAVALSVSLIAFIPWIHELIVHREMIANTNAWSAERWPFMRLATKWGFNAGTTFFDLEYLDLRWGVVLMGVVAAAALGIGITFRRAELEARWLLGSLIVIPALLLVVPDLVLGQHRSGVTRYELSIFSALSIAAAYGLMQRPKLATFVLCAAATACSVSALHASWWDNDANVNDSNIAAAIDAVARPYVVTRIPPEDAVIMTRLLHADARLIFFDGHISQQHLRTSDPIFVLRPSREDRMEARAKLGWILQTVPYRYALSAHEIGSRFSQDVNAAEDNRFELFRVAAVRTNTLASEPPSPAPR